MTDMSTLLAQLEALKAARRSGTRVVQYGDSRVEYRSDAELMAAIASVQTEIAAEGGTSRPTVAVVRSSKGY
ncbi:phage head-tail joining protein [Bradyrhizobium ottawaense]|uniref:phage head-tail joining protein n=1 Tax=Bradyrhizobium ottawaense TaxID=931866 RepID=UPI0030C6A36C